MAFYRADGPVTQRRITVIGLGYVGLTTAAGFAELGHRVVGLDIDMARIDRLQRGETPIFEPGLDALIARNVTADRLRFTTAYDEALKGAEFVFIAVPTPSTSVGAADLSYVRDAVHEISRVADRPLPVIVNKSTVPIGTGDSVESIITSAAPSEEVHVVSNPEFTREGTAVRDFLEPERIVVGSNHEPSALAVAQLYAGVDSPIVLTDIRTAEMIKYASNAFLATKISFINEIAGICENVGADVTWVAEGMGLDRRIGRAFLNAGLGFGGSCLPKDVKALVHLGSVYGTHPQLLNTVLQINANQRRLVVKRLRDELGALDGKRICLLGLTFKPNTDDSRDAPSRDLIPLLAQEGAALSFFDPVATGAFTAEYPHVAAGSDAYDAARDADAVVVVTEWDDFRSLDPQRLSEVMRGRLIVDTRNCLEAEPFQRAGFRYLAVGKPISAPISVAAT